MCSCSGSCNCNSTTIPRGPQGPAGPQGLNGTIWLNGSGDPSPSDGLNNDYWLDTDTGNLWIKAYQGVDLLWFYVTNIYGTPGIDGVALQLIPFAGGFFKSLGISNWITPASTGLNLNYYSTLFYLLGNDLCPVDNSVAKITIFYETTGQEVGVSGAPAYINHNFYIFLLADGILQSLKAVAECSGETEFLKLLNKLQRLCGTSTTGGCGCGCS